MLQKKIIPALVNFLPVVHTGLSFDYKLKAFVFGAPFAVGIRQQMWISAFGERQVRELFTGEFLDSMPSRVIHEDIDKNLAKHALRNVDEASMYLYERYFLGDQVLAKVDRASMAASLEARAPFLDVRVVEFAHRIPVNLRMRFWQNKWLLKKLMRGKLPDKILDRPKKGFWMPIGPWLKKELQPLVREYLNSERLKRQRMFNPAFVEQLIYEHQNNKRDHRRILWSLLMFQLWQERWERG